MLIAFVSITVFCGGIAVGVKVSKFVRERRKANALDYMRQTGLYPQIYTGYPDTQPRTHPTPAPHQNANAATLIDQFLYIGIVVAVLYAFWCGLT